MRFKIDRASLIVERNLPFSLCFTLYLRAISKDKPPGGLYLRGDLTEGLLRYEFGELTFGGPYFRKFTVYFGYFRGNLDKILQRRCEVMEV